MQTALAPRGDAGTFLTHFVGAVSKTTATSGPSVDAGWRSPEESPTVGNGYHEMRLDGPNLHGLMWATPVTAKSCY